jgi:hypothetical protein
MSLWMITSELSGIEWIGVDVLLFEILTRSAHAWRFRQRHFFAADEGCFCAYVKHRCVAIGLVVHFEIHVSPPYQKLGTPRLAVACQLALALPS